MKEFGHEGSWVTEPSTELPAEPPLHNTLSPSQRGRSLWQASARFSWNPKISMQDSRKRRAPTGDKPIRALNRVASKTYPNSIPPNATITNMPRATSKLPPQHEAMNPKDFAILEALRTTPLAMISPFLCKAPPSGLRQCDNAFCNFQAL
jgi:hypothetical protein